jgi:endonuclease/exonuclease/phosphatase family metal-dependent hydrolase
VIGKRRVRKTCFSTLCALFIILSTSCALSPARIFERSLRVMTYNIAAGHGDLALIEHTIREANADLVALQEVDVHWGERSGFLDQATMLAQRLGMDVRFAHIYQMPAPDPNGPPREYGVALLSRHPIVSWTNHPLTRLSTQEESPTPERMPGFMEATVQLQGTTVHVFNTHLDYRPDPAVRKTQIAEMLSIIALANGPTLLFGDLNAPPDAEEIQPLLQRMRDPWRDAKGPGHTYPANAPTRRIDYILVSEHFRVRDARVLDSVASDHRPVVIELALGSTTER